MLTRIIKNTETPQQDKLQRLLNHLDDINQQSKKIKYEWLLSIIREAKDNYSTFYLCKHQGLLEIISAPTVCLSILGPLAHVYIRSSRINTRLNSINLQEGNEDIRQELLAIFICEGNSNLCSFKYQLLNCLFNCISLEMNVKDDKKAEELVRKFTQLLTQEILKFKKEDNLICQTEEKEINILHKSKNFLDNMEEAKPEPIKMNNSLLNLDYQQQAEAARALNYSAIAELLGFDDSLIAIKEQQQKILVEREKSVSEEKKVSAQPLTMSEQEKTTEALIRDMPSVPTHKPIANSVKFFSQKGMTREERAEKIKPPKGEIVSLFALHNN